MTPGFTPVTDASAAWGDYDSDGDLDLVIIGWDGAAPVSTLYENEGGVFVDAMAGLLPVSDGDVVWGDLDGDSDLDLVLTGAQSSGTPATRTYRNDAGIFVEGAGIVGVTDGMLMLGDTDNDGDLDLVVTGRRNNGSATLRLYENEAGTFTGFTEGFGGVVESAGALGDYDDDGDLDLLISGERGTGPETRILDNENGTFVDNGAGSILEQVARGSVAWGDYDADGDLDIFLTGLTADSTRIAGVYESDLGSWTSAPFSTKGVERSSGGWADYDGDGDLDLAYIGYQDLEVGYARLVRNDGGSFVNAAAGLGRTFDGEIAWADYDGDGDLDFVKVGEGDGGPLAEILRNDGALVNTVPAAPSGLSTSVVDGAMVVSWSPGNDAETPANGLTYNLRAGTSPGANDLVPSMALPSGVRNLTTIGNAQHRTSWTFPDALSLSNATFSVQCIDGSLAGSPFSADVQAPAVVDLNVSVDAAASTLALGATTVVTISLENDSPGTGATGSAIVVTIDSGLAYVSHAPSQGTYDPGTGFWTVPTVGPGGTETLAITVEVVSAPQSGSAAVVASLSAVNELDAYSANDTDLHDIAIEQFRTMASSVVAGLSDRPQWGDFDNDGDLDLVVPSNSSR